MSPIAPWGRVGCQEQKTLHFFFITLLQSCFVSFQIICCHHYFSPPSTSPRLLRFFLPKHHQASLAKSAVPALIQRAPLPSFHLLCRNLGSCLILKQDLLGLFHITLHMRSFSQRYQGLNWDTSSCQARALCLWSNRTIYPLPGALFQLLAKSLCCGTKTGKWGLSERP